MTATQFFEHQHGKEEFLSKSAIVKLMEDFHKHYFTEVKINQPSSGRDVNLGVLTPKRNNGIAY